MDLFSEKYSLKLGDAGILPVICFKNQKELDAFLASLLQTSVKCIEITLRHPFSTEAIRYIKRRYPEIIVGAGTVNTAEKLNEAINCGADFCVSPGTLDELLKLSYEKKMPFLPGCSTPSEIMKLSALGYKTVKYFPAEGSGGVKTLKLYEGAFAGMKFLPTGGITVENFADYSGCKNVIACGGSFMAQKAMIESGDSAGILSTMDRLTDVFKGVKANENSGIW